MKDLSVRTLPVCESCLEGKMTKRPFTTKGLRVEEPLGLIHSDVCGPLAIQAKGGYEYFVNLKDDYLCYSQAYLMRRKFDTFEMFKGYRASVKR